MYVILCVSVRTNQTYTGLDAFEIPFHRIRGFNTTKHWDFKDPEISIDLHPRVRDNSLITERQRVETQKTTRVGRTKITRVCYDTNIKELKFRSGMEEKDCQRSLQSPNV